ncbi:MAG TPA: carboxypeptidase-like regulatory domain-containing protein [Flavisolibacter sp.]|jgi:hypothetical protein|nr:carboxypeptidase-like regulatory domain-containing protein [Flavisolibacter sp.]
MKYPILIICCLFICLCGNAQSVITGKVIDSATREPLQNASVFAQNTTRGTVSDKEGNFRLYLDKGGYELVISYTGYTSKSIKIESTADRQLNIEMEKADNIMGEIIIRSSNEVPDGWEKYGKFFIQHFIGTTPFADSCTLQNPEVLKFLYFKRSDRLKILASEPLIIVNKALGYNLRYELDSFVHRFQTDNNSYRGRCLYLALEGTPEQQQLWKNNREQVYYGSRLHFLRSYYDSSLTQEGFTIATLSKIDPNKFDRLENPYDTTYYFYNDSSSNAELWFPDKISITYDKKRPEKEYLRQYHLPLNVPVQMSYVDFSEGIIIRPNGYFFDQKSWINQGYWSWKNLADLLPYDYVPNQ